MPKEMPKEFRDLMVERDILKQDPSPQTWANWQGSILLRDEIRRYCEGPIKLIRPFDEQYLKSASYHLRLGEECRVDGKDYTLSDKNRSRQIPPHGIAIVRTYEYVNIPGFLIARWNLRVTAVYKGLVWVGSLQVDPGYQGFLFCPLYNLSTRPQELRYKEELFTIDFVKTTVFDESKGCKLWEAKDGRPTYSLAYLDTQRLESAPKATEEKARSAEVEVRRLQGITFTLLTIVIATVALLTAVGELGPIKIPPHWVDLPLGLLSVLALLISIIALLIAVVRRRK